MLDLEKTTLTHQWQLLVEFRSKSLELLAKATDWSVREMALPE
jgi:hypothetical protein